MSDKTALTRIHPEGERERLADEGREEPLAAPTSLDTFGGKIQVKWAPEAAVSAFGQMAFFIEFLKTSGLFDAWVNDCPLRYTSRNAPEKRNGRGSQPDAQGNQAPHDGSLRLLTRAISE